MVRFNLFLKGEGCDIAERPENLARMDMTASPYLPDLVRSCATSVVLEFTSEPVFSFRASTCQTFRRHRVGTYDFRYSQ